MSLNHTSPLSPTTTTTLPQTTTYRHTTSGGPHLGNDRQWQDTNVVIPAKHDEPTGSTREDMEKSKECIRYAPFSLFSISFTYNTSIADNKMWEGGFPSLLCLIFDMTTWWGGQSFLVESFTLFQHNGTPFQRQNQANTMMTRGGHIHFSIY